MSDTAVSETDPDVIQALYDLEVAKAQRFLAGEKKGVDFSRLERGRVVANSRDEEYLNAWNVQLPSVDFSGEALEDDLALTAKFQTEAVELIVSIEVVGKRIVVTIATPGKHFGPPLSPSSTTIGGRANRGFNLNSDGKNRDVGFAQAAQTSTFATGPSITHQNSLRGASPARRIGHMGRRLRSPARRTHSPIRRAISPVRQGTRGRTAVRPGDRRKGSSGGLTFEERLDKALKIGGAGAYGAGAGMRKEALNAQWQPPKALPKASGPAPAPRSGSSATSRHSPMTSQPQPPPPTQSATGTQQPVAHLASPGEFMVNAHKLWETCTRHGSTFDAATSSLGGVTGTAKASLNEGGAECHTSQQLAPVAARTPQEEPESLVMEGKGQGKGRETGSEESDYWSLLASNRKLLCSQFPQVSLEIVKLFLNRSNGNINDARIELAEFVKPRRMTPSSPVEEIAMHQSRPLTSIVQDEPDLIDLATVEWTMSPPRTLAALTETQTLSMDDDLLITFEEAPRRPRSAHLLDDDFHSPIPWLKPTTLAPRNGNILEGHVGDSIATDKELSSLSSQLANFSLSENPSPQCNIPQDSKMLVVHKLAPPTSVQAHAQAARVATGTPPTAIELAGTPLQGLGLATSIWANENRKDSR
ncbi:hypothetical protein FGG08_002070 [Glutinoglossum americanum]|uniref:Uncharacterized protein n=1 Tax=Glutinoglossum americanum TaxID=1670608 RepID=A0A9P8L4S7_9PEZI|nr:hypothetical protein FGG08_002070 [Glutinoglossum americanum]